jgi:hypothetical protein
MKQDRTPPAPSRAPRCNADYRWTMPKALAFLEALAKTGKVAAAARAVGMSRQAGYRLRDVRRQGGAPARRAAVALGGPGPRRDLRPAKVTRRRQSYKSRLKVTRQDTVRCVRFGRPPGWWLGGNQTVVPRHQVNPGGMGPRSVKQRVTAKASCQEQ